MHASEFYIQAFLETSNELEKLSASYKEPLFDVSLRTRKEISKLINKHIPNMRNDPEAVDRVLKGRSRFSRVKSSFFDVDPKDAVMEYLGKKKGPIPKKSSKAGSVGAGMLLGAGGTVGAGAYLADQAQKDQADRQSKQRTQREHLGQMRQRMMRRRYSDYPRM